MTIDKEASRRWRQRLGEILDIEWDPIGVGDDAQGECDGYAGKVAAMLREGASDEDLFAYLTWAETEHMGMRGNPDRLRTVIAAIRALGFVT